MYKVHDISEGIVIREFTSSSKLMMQDKMSRGDIMIDIRTWNRWSTDGQWHPTTNGLHIVKSEFIEILPKIMSLLTDGKNNYDATV